MPCLEEKSKKERSWAQGDPRLQFEDEKASPSRLGLPSLPTLYHTVASASARPRKAASPLLLLQLLKR